MPHRKQWISFRGIGTITHPLRAVVDADCVGSGTLGGRPQLTARDFEGGYSPPSHCGVVSIAATRSEHMPASTVADETVLLDTGPYHGFALKALHDRGVRHVLLEGSPTLAGPCRSAVCIDEIVAYNRPKLLGRGSANPLGAMRDRDDRKCDS